MALDEGKLSAGIEDALVSVKEGAEDQASSAAKIAQAVVDYATDAEITVTAPWILTSTGAPDPSVVGMKFPVSTAPVGQAALVGGIMGSFAAGDSYALFAVGLVAYVAASFVTFAQGPITIAGAAVMAAPPALGGAADTGREGGTEADIAAALAKEIHGAFTKSIFNGAGTGPASAGPVLAVMLE